jgi:Exodeoxyribonuclease X-like C-terminal
MPKPIPPMPLDPKIARLRAARLSRPVPVPTPGAVRTLGLEDELKFGKHKGETLLEVMDSDLSYVTWMMETLTDFVLSDEAEREYHSRLDPRRPRGV